MSVSKYVPQLYENNTQMNAIADTEDRELSTRLTIYIDKAFADTFVKTATLSGIENYEKLLNILISPDEDIQTRRERILYRLSSKIPFTLNTLKNSLTSIVGEGNYEMTMNYGQYHLVVNITTPGRTWYNEIYNLLDTIVPCNIFWELNLYKASWQQVKNSFATWNDITSMTWQDVLDGEYT